MSDLTIKISEGWNKLLKSYEEEHFSDQRLKARLEGELQVRRMLEDKAGQMSKDEIKRGSCRTPLVSW